MGYSPQGRKESDTTERLNFNFHGKIRTEIARRMFGSLMTIWHCPDNQVGVQWLVLLNGPVCGLLHSLVSCLCHELSVRLVCDGLG